MVGDCKHLWSMSVKTPLFGGGNLMHSRHCGHRAKYLVCATLVLVALGIRSPLAAEEGPIAGIELGAAVPLGKLEDRIDTGGMFSLFGGYMFLDYVGLTGQLQVVAAPGEDTPGFPDDDVAAQVGFTAGPRVELPLRKWTTLGARSVTFYLTGQPGLFTGIAGSPFSDTAFGYTAGGGVNVRLSDLLLLGGFARYNWVDEDVQNANGNRGRIEYVTAGIALTFNPAPPLPAVAQAPVTREPVPPMQKRIVLRGVNFDFDKATIRKEARPILDEAIATLQREGTVSIVAEGHTDSKGTDAYNENLSMRRANAVRDYLVAGGIAPSRIQVQGFGESRPVASNDTEDGRAQNRRVELRVR
jgi:outer membrane protein OmpA-like peptidoglycan-associated protein